ncbi:hypothetical protein JXI42_08845 [bacterium]|nr:hypothetical protein [bacterium]
MNIKNNISVLLTISFLLLIVFNTFPMEWSDDPAEIKGFNSQKKNATQAKTIFVKDKDHLPPPTITEWLYKNNFKKQVAVANESEVPRNVVERCLESIERGRLQDPDRSEARRLYRERPPFEESAEALDFSGDVPVRVDTGPERQPSIATGDDGRIYAVWAEQTATGNAIMCSRSTDEGMTWSAAVIVDDVGVNYFPQVAVWGTGPTARVHVVYNYVDWHIHDLIDPDSGTYIGTDTVYEGDVYYCRSSNGGSSFGHYQAIANNDIDLSDFGFPSIPGIPTAFHYDEGGADISVDNSNNVYVSYYAQSDEGHLANIVAWIVYIIIYYAMYGDIGFPPDWWDFNWYIVVMRCSSNGGVDFGSEITIKDEYLWSYSYCAHDVYGSGASAVVHIAYTDVGVSIPLLPPLTGGNIYYRQVENPLYSPSLTSEVGGWIGYVSAGGVAVDYEGNPKIGYSDIISASDFDVWYTRSTDGGASFDVPGSPVAVSVADEFEPRIAIDSSNSPFLAWTDARHGNYDIYTVWSEDGGLTLRPDQYRVNTYATSDQVVPGVSLYLDYCRRRLDIDWWDQRADDGDIYYANTQWWRTNLNVVLHDPLADSMEGTLTLSYYSFGQLVEVEISTGLRVVYHDSNTTITLDQMSSGSDETERWIWSEEGDWSATPAECGNTYEIVYYNQFNAVFTVTHANSEACTHEPPTGIPLNYYYFDELHGDSTIDTSWVDVASFYTYSSIFPDDPVDERWFCPAPTGRVTSAVVAPPFYHQWMTSFLSPNKLNDADCPHVVPGFNLIQRYEAGVNVGGVTPITALWTDCGSFYEYEDPKNISAYQRWDITAGATGVLVDLTPVQPDCYHQWTPVINLVGPSYPGNTVWTEAHTLAGGPVYDIDLWGTWTEWIDCGTELTFSEFTTLGWVARDPRSWDPVLTVFTATIRYGNVVAVTVRNDFGSGIVGVDSLTPSSPFVTGWAPGSEHLLCAISPQVFGHTRYIFTHWSDGGDTCHLASTTVDTTFTAYFSLQYLLEVVSDYGDPAGGGWYDAGAAATFWVTSYDSAVGGIRHEFQGWDGDGAGSYTGPDTGATVTMDNPITETADWNTQFYLEVTYTGCGSFVPTQTGEGWYNEAAFPTITTDSVLGGDSPDDSTRYVFDHWQSFPAGATFGDAHSPNTTLFMNRPYEVRAYYLVQYRFWVYNPEGLGDPDPPVGSYWFTEGTTVTGSVTSPWGDDYCLGFTGTGSLRDGTGSSFRFTIFMPSSITWIWGDMFTLTVVDTFGWILAAGHADPPEGVHNYIPGTSDTATVDEFVMLGGPSSGNRYRCTGYIGRGVIGSGDTNWVDFTMTETSTLQWLWIFENRFTVRDSNVWTGASNPMFDSPDPTFGQHWYESGTEITVSIHPWHGDYRCIGWHSPGGALPSGSGVGATFTIEWEEYIVWLWANISQVESLIVYSDHGVCSPPGSPAGVVNFFLRDAVVNAWTTLVAAGGDGERFINQGWTGTGCVPATGDSNSVLITMSTSGTITWNWSTQYRLRIINPGGFDSPFPPAGDYWYSAGTYVNCYVTTPDTVEEDSIMYCVGFAGTGTSLDGTDPSSTNIGFNMIDPTEITWLWESYMIPLYVYSAYGTPSPAGTTYHVPGSGVTALVNSPVMDATDGIRHLCTGWVGTGSVPPTGTETYVYFIIDDTTSITWQWHTQYRLTIDFWNYDGSPTVRGDPYPTIGDHWLDIGTHVTGWVRNPDPRDPSWVCTGYTGTGAALPTSPQTDFEFDLTEPSSVTWLWYPDSLCAKLTVVSEYDDPHPYGVTYWLLGSTVDAHVDSIVSTGGMLIICLGWHGYGSIDSNGTDNNVTFNIWEETYLVWDWSENLIFTVNNPRGYGTPDPPVGTYSYPPGSYISGRMYDWPEYDPIRDDTMYCIGYNGTGDLPPVSPQLDFAFTITEPSSITWLWLPADSVARLIVTSEYDDPHPYDTTFWRIGSNVNAHVDAFEEITPGIRAYCIGWTGTGSVRPTGTTNNMNFVIMLPSTIHWNWEIKYEFVIMNDGGYDTPVPPVGTYWHAESTWVEGFITDNPSGPADTFYCIGYAGTGSAPETSPQTDFGFYLTEPSTLTWLWAGAGSVRQLVVISDHDDPHPYGTTYWLIGSEVIAQVDSITEMVDSSAGYLCTGWTGTGSVDSAGSTYWTVFDIFENTTITWLWEGLYYLFLDHAGTPVEPVQEGEGWYADGDTVDFSTETPVYDDETGQFWGFVWWSAIPVGANIADTMDAATFIVMDGSYILIAHYNPAINHTIKKDPETDVYGWIQIDDHIYDSTSIVSTWWGIGSIHTIGVSEADTSDLSTFFYNNWSDRGARIHETTPVPGDVLDTTYRYIAYYTATYMCPIIKSPLHTCGTITVDGEVYDSAGSVIMWWLPGSVHEICVSTPDYCDTLAYFFTEWSDSGDTCHETDTITAPTAFIAFYDQKYQLLVKKNPAENYGWVMFEGDTIPDTSEYSFWVDLGETYEIGVSEYDLGPEPRYDSIYIYLEWDGEPAEPRIRDVGPIAGPTEKVANYLGEYTNLGFILSRYHWNIDTMNLNNTATMHDTDMILITNIGNTPIDFGLMVDSVGTALIDSVWSPAYMVGPNQFSLRARFNDILAPPGEFNPTLDFVKYGLTWATKHPIWPIFGEGGVCVFPNYPVGRHPAPESTENLWMQFWSPTTSRVYSETVTIVVLLIGKPHLP